MDGADLRRAPAWVDVFEKLAGRGRDVLVRRALRRRWELQAAPVAEPGARALCTRVVARFVEQSCAVLAVAEPRALPPLEPQAEHSRKPLASPAQEESLQAVRPDVLEVRPPAKTRPALIRPEAALQVSKEQLEPELHSRELPVVPPLVLLQEGQRLWGGLLRPEARQLVFLQEARPARDSPPDAAQPAERRLPSFE